MSEENNSVCSSLLGNKVYYEKECEKRYQEARRTYNDQFLKELAVHEALEPSAMKAEKIHRNFCNPVLKSSEKVKLVKLSDKQKRKIEEVLKDDLWN